MERIEALNRALFLKINAGLGSAPWMIDGAVVIANDLIYLIPVLLIAMWLRGNEAKRRLAIQTCLTAMLGLGLNQVISSVWQHPRPFAMGLGHAWAQHVADSSFPSDHMTIFTAIGISLLLGRERLLGSLTLAAGSGVAWARIFLGLHFPLDMLGAVGVACLSYAALSPLWRHTGDRVTRFVERLYQSFMAWPIAQGWMRR
ncbi:phosphatase PAP2 family protein [Sulfuriferula sp. GW1]|uniref:phosphatase PAP2 family protein n=1 Tax=Sulfuriferula sp. GW1 TaxID=3345111 RepID=UPI0039AEF796